MKRSAFIKRLGGMALIAIPAYQLLSCSSSDDSTDEPQNNTPDCELNGAKAGIIASNHGHTLTVSKQDVAAGVEKTYNIQGTSQHNHMITVTAANFQALRNNQQAVVNSSNENNHTHSVTIVCA